MASLNQVTLELKVTGEAQATKALQKFAEAGNKVGTSIAEVGRKVSGIEGELKSLVDLNRRKVITDRELAEAQEKHAKALAALTGRTVDQSRAALEAMVNAKRKEEADKRAAQAAEQLARSQKNLEGSVLRQAQAVNQAVQRMDELARLQAKGAVVSRDMAQAELEIARALARTNGYLKSNGALNIQKALAELRAAQATRKATAEQVQQNAANAAARQSYNQLLASINPTIAAQQRMRQAHEQVRAALAAGIITRQQAAQTLREYRAAATASAVASQQQSLKLNQMGVVAQQAGYQVGDFFVQIQSGTNVMVAFGQQATQLVGTFAMFAKTTRAAVIASGIGIFISIATAVGAAIMRMNGQMDTLDTKVQKMTSSFDDLNTSMDRLEDSELDQTFGNLTDEIESITEAMVELNNAAALNNLMSTFEKLEGAAEGGFFSQMGAGALNLLRIIDPASAQLDKALGLEPGTGLFGVKTTGDINREAFEKLGYDMSREQYLAYLDGLQELASQGDIEGVTKLIGRFFEDATDGAAEVSMQGIAVAQSMEQAAIATAKTAARLNGSAEVARRAAEAEKERVKSARDYEERLSRTRQIMGEFIAERREQEKRAAEEAAESEERRIDQRFAKEAELMSQNVSISAENAQRSLDIIAAEERAIDQRFAKEAELMSQSLTAVQSQTAAIMDQTELSRRRLEILQSYNSEGEATAETLELEIALASDLLRRQGLRKAAADGLTQAERDAVEALVEANAEILRAQAGLDNATSAAKGLTAELRAAASAMASLAGMGATIDVRIAGLEAEINAYAQGLNAQAERRRATELEKARQERDQALLAPGADVAGIDAVFQGVVQRLDREAMLTAERDAIAKAKREASRSKGGSGTEEESNRAKAAVDQLVASYDEQYAMSLKVAEATRKIEEAQRLGAIPANMEAEQILRDYIASLEDAESPMLVLANTMSDALGDALMSVVDGTKSASDAFSDMARIIIKKAFEMAVINPILNSIFGGVSGFNLLPTFGSTSANGNVFSGGNVIPFANGGVVGGPTTFPMANGQTGLMGEAGPEAIMPLKRGKDGKLGVTAEGGGNVTVENHFHIAANGDDSVKRIIAQEAPRIANLTQKQIMDQRRRGGAMKATFG